MTSPLRYSVLAGKIQQKCTPSRARNRETFKSPMTYETGLGLGKIDKFAFFQAQL